MYFDYYKAVVALGFPRQLGGGASNSTVRSNWRSLAVRGLHVHVLEENAIGWLKVKIIIS